MTELSPAAQAVLDAVHDVIPDTSLVEVLAIAAALRAAVAYTKDCPVRDVWQCDADELLAIVDELENQ